MAVLDDLMKPYSGLFEEVFLSTNADAIILKPERASDLMAKGTLKKTGKYTLAFKARYRVRKKSVRDNRNRDERKTSVYTEIKIRFKADVGKNVDNEDVIRLIDADYSIAVPYTSRQLDAVFVEFELIRLDARKEVV